MTTAAELPGRVSPRVRPTLYRVDLGFTHPDYPFRSEMFTRRSDAEQFIAMVRADNPFVAAKLRIEEWKL
jgi:hypothetical protein